MSDHLPKLAFDLDRDIRVLSVMASSLTPYLYENELYGYLEGDLPRLTLGGLLLRLHRLGYLEDTLSAEQQNLVQNARLNFEAERAQWAVHYENKIQHELRARLDAFEQFLNECSGDIRGCAEGYPVQAEKRVMIAHLADESEERDVLPEETSTRLKVLDQRLHRLLREGGFVFDDRLLVAYPPEQYWWLYSHIPEH